MSDIPNTIDFTPYACSIGNVLDHGDGTFYRMQLSTGQVIAVPANGTPSKAAIEVDLGNPPAPPDAPLSQSTDVVVDRLTDTEVSVLTAATAPAFARRAWLVATSVGSISTADPRYTALTAALDAAGIIAASRWPVLLAP
jgi:hypothetical protein